jgi:hypothetical protein
MQTSDSEQLLHDKTTLDAVEDLFGAAAKLGIFAAKTVARLESHDKTKKPPFRPFDLLEVTAPHTQTKRLRVVQR